MKNASSRSALAWGALLALGFAVGAGCMNGAMHNYKARIGGIHGRFALVVESDRTDVEGSHFLLDTTTGDLWRLDSRDGRSGAWVRLGEGPADARALETSGRAEGEDDA